MLKQTKPTSAAKTIFIMTPVTIASYLLVFLLCVVTLIYGLLPGLLAACLGYLLAVVLAG